MVARTALQEASRNSRGMRLKGGTTSHHTSSCKQGRWVTGRDVGRGWCQCVGRARGGSLQSGSAPCVAAITSQHQTLPHCGLACALAVMAPGPPGPPEVHRMSVTIFMLNRRSSLRPSTCGRIRFASAWLLSPCT